MAIDWRIYYADGQTYSSADGFPEDAPRHRGVACVVCQDRSAGRYIWQYCDWYVLDRSGEWRGHNETGMLFRLRLEVHNLVLAFPGEYMNDDDFNDVMTAINKDPDFVATARSLKEQKLSEDPE